MGTMEDQIRKIVREEIARALRAIEDVADAVYGRAETDSAEEEAAQMLRRTMERVARDVLANTHPEIPGHPVLSTEHAPDDACTCGHDRYRHRSGACFACSCPGFTDPFGHAASTYSFCMEYCAECGKHTNRVHLGNPCPNEHAASTEPVHTITAVPERARAACTCHRHTHVMGHDDRCGAPFCYCLSPVRARAGHTGVHASTEPPRTCTVCEHGEHDQGKCTMHVYLRGVASPCPCLASRTLGAQRPEGSRLVCTVCEHARHGAGDCRYAAMCLGQVVKCACGGRA